MNGDDIELRHGDKVITLAEQLAAMQKAIRRLEVATAIVIGLIILSALVTDEVMLQLFNTLLGGA